MKKQIHIIGLIVLLVLIALLTIKGLRQVSVSFNTDYAKDLGLNPRDLYKGRGDFVPATTPDYNNTIPTTTWQLLPDWLWSKGGRGGSLPPTLPPTTTTTQAPVGFLGDASISAEASGRLLRISTSQSMAGAIYSVTWGGKEFIDSSDHGRELQSASSFNNWGECYNPTEAGSAADGSGQTSTSRVLSLTASGNSLRSRTQMAFWFVPGQHTTQNSCGSAPGGVAQNTTALSNHILEKKVTIGFGGISNIIEDIVTYIVPQSYNSAGFEALTGYMPRDFNTFWTYNPKTKNLTQVSPSAVQDNNTRIPVIISTSDRQYAMGIYSPDSDARYNLWNFYSVTKWNVAFFPAPVSAGNYTYRNYIPVGTLSDVTSALDKLYANFGH